MIKIDNMSKIYKMGDNIVTALDGVNIHIKKQEFVAIVGPSGSGKSTLMNMLGCLDTPSKGKYYLDGYDVSKLNDNEQAEIRNSKISFIFQGFNLLQKLSALENVEMPLIYKGISTKERMRRAMEALDVVGLKERMRHKPNELSGGQQQRVAIARALAGDTPIILADEPTGNLDTKTGIEIMKIIQDLNDNGKTIILITHDNETALKAKRIIRITDGVITEDREVK